MHSLASLHMRTSICALLLFAVLAIAPAASVGASTFPVTVTTTADTNNPTCATTGSPGPSPGTCSLRDAIRFANTHPGATDTTTITVPGNLALYRLTQTGSGED